MNTRKVCLRKPYFFDVAKYSLKPNVRKGKTIALGIVDAEFTKAMALYMISA
jgi:hypothetical protein